MWELLPLDWHVVGVGDFNGDGISDILLRNDNGTVTDWLGQPNGTLVDNSQHASFGTGADWQIVGTGDFNGDGMSGVLWRRNDGAMSDWLGDSNGSFTVNSAVNITTGSEWQIAGTGDFNGDGRTDVLWRRNDGALSDWLGQQNGGFWINTNFNATAGTEWKVVGTGDFNGDGKADLLWERTDGALSDWLGQANGGFAVNSGISLNAGAGWHVAGVGDFNDDGFSDLLWRKDDGTITNWLGWANGAFTDNSSIASQPVSTDLQVAGVGDFNGDGFSDVLLRNTDGTLETWVGSTGGGILSTSEKLWEDARSSQSIF